MGRVRSVDALPRFRMERSQVANIRAIGLVELGEEDEGLTARLKLIQPVQAEL